jgi:hypothetical protein
VISASPTSFSCGGSSLIHAQAGDTDTDGISAVKLWYTLDGVHVYGPISMTFHNSVIVSQRYWYGSITDPGWGVASGQVSYWVQAFDTRGSYSGTTYPPAAYDVTYSCSI